MRDQITTVVRLILTLLGSLLIVDAEFISFVTPLVDQAIGITFEVIAIVGLVTDKIKSGGASIKSTANPFMRALLLAD